MSKGQGLSLNTIIIAVLVVIVLVVLVAIFTGALGNFVPSITGGTERTCSGNGFETPSEAAGCSPGYKQVYGKFKEGELQPGQICCQLPVTGGGGGLSGPQPKSSNCIQYGPRDACVSNGDSCASGFSPAGSNTCGEGWTCCIQSG